MERNREAWLLDVLQTAFRASKLSAEELERRLGWEDGLLDRLLQGEAVCEPQHVVALLGELHTRSDRALFRSNRPGSREGAGEDPDAMVEELLEKFSRLGYGSVAELLPKGEPTGAELERRVEAVLRGAFGRRAEGRS